MKQGKDQEAWKWATSDAMRASYQDYMSTKLLDWTYFWTLALLEFRLGKKQGYQGEYLKVS